MSEKIKFYKNPARNIQDNSENYIPQYKTRGVVPETVNRSVGINQSSNNTAQVKNVDNPRLRSNMVIQPYGSVVQSPIGQGQLPNVGNNMEHTWSSTEIIDDLNLDPNQEMIDNNEYVTDTALGIKTETFQTKQTPKQVESESNIFGIINNAEDNECILFVKGAPICSGIISLIQDQVALLIYGEHPEFKDQSILVDDIVVLKKVPIKVGVFLE